jgi:hypothetical protein
VIERPEVMLAIWVIGSGEAVERADLCEDGFEVVHRLHTGCDEQATVLEGGADVIVKLLNASRPRVH